MAKNDISKEKLSIEDALENIQDGETIKLVSLPAVPEIRKILEAYPDEKKDSKKQKRTD